MHKIMIPTGYMGSGSSAITDLLSEYEGYEAPNGTYEYVFLHCPNGLFDLEDRLFAGNHMMQSDAALHAFEMAMRDLYGQRLWWCADYKHKVSQDFMRMTMDYIEDLTEFLPDCYWYPQEKYTFWIFLKMCWRKLVMLVSFGRVVPKRPLLYHPTRIAMPSREEFYEKSRRYLKRVFEAMGLGEKNLILDQLLLPCNAHRMEAYFGEDAECFVVDRDPRDLFLSNKYAWAKQNCPVPYPTDVQAFCGFYRKLRAMEKPCDNPRIHRVHFEDLVYHYGQAVGQIEGWLGLTHREHVRPRGLFDPDRSIGNTQLFQAEAYRAEAHVIEEELPEYLYAFPYARESDMAAVF